MPAPTQIAAFKTPMARRKLITQKSYGKRIKLPSFHPRRHVVVFVLDLPPRSARLDQAAHVLSGDLPVGDEGVVVKDRPLAVGDGDFEPVDL